MAMAFSCGSPKEQISTIEEWDNQSFEEQHLYVQSEVDSLIEMNLNAQEKHLPRHSASDKPWQLKHSDLKIDFDWKTQSVNGEATLTLTPYFYPQNTLKIDAKGMDIHHIEYADQRGLKKGPSPDKLNWEHRNNEIIIDFGYDVSPHENLKLSILYSAYPNRKIADARDLSQTAVTDDKGLYFINADGTHPYHPRQIWTQGEPHSNSHWFPTIDQPNQKHTHNIQIKRPDSLVSISNGILINSVSNSDGSTTDFWEMNQPHSVYLTMMAIGPWVKIQDTSKFPKVNSFEWAIVPTNYYVEKGYESFAKDIFGNTPEMISFFSDYTGVNYPWSKYDQIVAREFVSGAMENTTAVIHNHRLQDPTEEMEDYISHELFHHWFGDLVTAESWGDLSMNESFATYGEYLWREHKYGIENAESWLIENRTRGDFNPLTNQFEAQKSTPLIHHHYKHPNDQFDDVRYNKGARILHMLRKQIGDVAFRKSIQCYLNTRAYKNGNAHHWKHCIEDVTGKNMDDFFNSWYFQGGEFGLKIETYFDSTLSQQVAYLRPYVAEVPTLNTDLLAYGRSKEQSLKVQVVGKSGKRYEYPIRFNPSSTDTLIELQETDSLVYVTYPEPQAHFNTSVIPGTLMDGNIGNWFTYQLDKTVHLSNQKNHNRILLKSEISGLTEIINYVNIDSSHAYRAKRIFDSRFENEINTVTPKEASSMMNALVLYLQCQIKSSNSNAHINPDHLSNLHKKITQPLKTHALGESVIGEVLKMASYVNKLNQAFFGSTITGSEKILNNSSFKRFEQTVTKSEYILLCLATKRFNNPNYNLLSYFDSDNFKRLSIPGKADVLIQLFNHNGLMDEAEKLEFAPKVGEILKEYPDLFGKFIRKISHSKDPANTRMLERIWDSSGKTGNQQVVKFELKSEWEEMQRFDWSNPALNQRSFRLRHTFLKSLFSTNEH